MYHRCKKSRLVQYIWQKQSYLIMILHCDLDLEDSKLLFSHDALAPNHTTLSYKRFSSIKEDMITIPHCDLDLESKPILLHDTLAHDHTKLGYKRFSSS